ncbi:MAG TPA: hypothetical protein VMU93_07030 [Caulobacteraceae bacterium]|nr:hypothetical protein [Caulobacteraceae bacterium]
MADDYIPGTLDVAAKLASYRRFLAGMRYVVLAQVVALSFLILTFCGAGLGAGLFVAVVELVGGLYLARRGHRTGAASEMATAFVTTSSAHPHPVEDQAEQAARAASIGRAA